MTSVVCHLFLLLNIYHTVRFIAQFIFLFLVFTPPMLVHKCLMNTMRLCPTQEFDKKYNPTWHCIVGRNFGSYVTHETKHFIYFYLGQVAILLFKSG